MISKLSILLLLFSSISIAKCQDTIPKFNPETQEWYEGKTPYVLMSLGLFTFKDDGFLNRKDFKNLRNRYIPRFSNHIDDYTQFAPFLMVYALNWSGIEGRHTPLVASKYIGTSLLISTAVVTGMKYTINSPRPDRSANNSFPSGHTTTAFIAATVLHKEFGETVSPYYSFGAYSLASFTGVFRQLNNRHWISDVLFGAGLGILTTEFTYAILEEDVDHKEDLYDIYYEQNYDDNLFLRYNLGYSHVVYQEEKKKHYPTHGFTFGIESAYFFDSHFGLGGHLKITSFPLTKTENDYSSQFPQLMNTETADPFGLAALSIGPYYRLNLSQNSTLMFKSLYGVYIFADGRLTVDVNENDVATLGRETVHTKKYLPKQDHGFELGLSYNYNISKIHSLNLSLDYTNVKPKINILSLSEINSNNELIYTKERDNAFIDVEYLTVGLSYSISF